MIYGIFWWYYMILSKIMLPFIPSPWLVTWLHILCCCRFICFFCSSTSPCDISFLANHCCRFTEKKVMPSTLNTARSCWCILWWQRALAKGQWMSDLVALSKIIFTRHFSLVLSAFLDFYFIYVIFPRCHNCVVSNVALLWK